MARVYDVAVSALALDVDPKWLDNLLSQHEVPGVARSVRGLARRIPLSALVIIAIARDLQRELGVGIARGVPAASRLAASGDTGGRATLSVGHSLALRADLARVRHDLEDRLVDAMEVVVPRRRGRPISR